ncbi:hypothetical protein VCRA2119O54_870001 [Vibrio crassostreae]|nr:hypothetical protein VCRA2119O54_870001 [Vibrio crassostreae]
MTLHEFIRLHCVRQVMVFLMQFPPDKVNPFEQLSVAFFVCVVGRQIW